MDKKDLSERDICTKFITPAVEKAAWDITTHIREEFPLTNGRIIVRGKLHTRAANKRADYILFYKPGIPIAVIEAKDNHHSIADRMQQALYYSDMIHVPFVFSSNGDGFLFHNKIKTDGKTETEIGLENFPSPDALWNLWTKYKGINTEQEAIVTQDYYSDGSNKTPRYYQLLAINKTVEAIAQEKNRVLLVMATGTGKTFTAFQIIWRLWKSKTKKRILFLADRNILVDQTMTNDFKPFGSAMTKIQKRQANKSYEIYLSLYQAVTGPEEEQISNSALLSLTKGVNKMRLIPAEF
jgi:type I restriction enzyme R subunit